MAIGEAAGRLGLRPSALRYYDEQGLVAPRARQAGRRMYGPAELRQLAFLKIAHRLGIPWTPPPCSARLVPGGGAPCGTRSPSWIGSSIRHRTLSGAHWGGRLLVVPWGWAVGSGMTFLFSRK
jgi:hypothetical protein